MAGGGGGGAGGEEWLLIAPMVDLRMLTTKRQVPDTFDQLLAELGDIDPKRVRLAPPPGRAKVTDVVRLNDRYGRLYELVDGTLVEKVMGFPDSSLATYLIREIGKYLDHHDIGELVGADGMMQIFPNLVRIPDVAFISRQRLPGGVLPTAQVPAIVPDLAVEVISPGNTKREMERKLNEYFRAGVSVVWFVYRLNRTVAVYTAPDVAEVLSETDTLDGKNVLPGFRLSLAKLFGRVPREPARKNGKKKPRN
jgi:Uma2 family endonuclease